MDASAGAGSSNAPGAGVSSCCYYALLGIRKNASSTDIRAAYRRLAMKWHPDRWASDPGAIRRSHGASSPRRRRLLPARGRLLLLPGRRVLLRGAGGRRPGVGSECTIKPGASHAMGEAKQRFQRIQEAYSVLSNKGKKAMYDAGLFDPLDDDDQDISDFMLEMLVMMDSVKNEKPDTLEDLQKMLDDIVNGDGGSRATAGAGGSGGGGGCGGRVPLEANRRTRVAPYPQPSRR